MPLPTQTQKHYELRLYDDVLLTFTATHDAFGTLSVHIDDVSVRDYHLLPLSLWPDETSGPRLLDWLNTRVIPKRLQICGSNPCASRYHR